MTWQLLITCLAAAACGGGAYALSAPRVPGGVAVGVALFAFAVVLFLVGNALGVA